MVSNCLVVLHVPEDASPEVYTSNMPVDKFIEKAKAVFNIEVAIERTMGINENETHWNDEDNKGELVFNDGSKIVYECSFTSDFEDLINYRNV